jgi:hypothetical protein
VSDTKENIPRSRIKPDWLAGHGGDTRALHQANVEKIESYLSGLRQNGRGLPANTLRPKTVSMELVAEESGVKLISLTRLTSQCRELIEDATASEDDESAPTAKARKRAPKVRVRKPPVQIKVRMPAIPIKVRLKDRVRPAYSLGEMINIATVVIQAECEVARSKHREVCDQVSSLLSQIARISEDGLAHDAGPALQSAVEQSNWNEAERTLLVRIDAIRLMATRGELELATFHGRLKLEATLRGFGLGALANFTSAATQTVINWGSGLKSPTRMFFNDIPKLEEALELPAGYLSDVRIDHRSGPSNVKRYHLPAEICAMSIAHQKDFRRLIDPTIDLRSLPQEEIEQLMAKTLEVFFRSRDTDDVKRAKLRSEEMCYALPELPPHLQIEFDALTKQRSEVLLMGIVPNKKRGWDPITVAIYKKRFQLFFGWLHKYMGISTETLTIAYLAFPQILNEFMLWLVERKESVGLQKGFSEVAREWYIFAASLTRGPLGGYDENDDEDDEGDADPVGWLRGQRDLVRKLVPILIPRRRDVLERGGAEKARPVLTSKAIAKATSNWADRLNRAARKYRSWRKEHEGNSTTMDSAARVRSILALENPLEAIEVGAFRIKEYIDGLSVGRSHWATAVRASVTLKFHAQLPLRRFTFCALTYHPNNTGMVRWENGRWWVQIPESLFKNEGTKDFDKFVVDGFFRQRLLDEWGLYEDLATYTEIARSRILDGVESPAFYVARHNEGHVSPGTFASQFRLLTRDYIAENPGTGTGLAGVRPFGSHAMRHIVATAVWKKTGSVQSAARAIHDSEKITEKYYRKIVEGAEEQSAMMSDLMRGATRGYSWSKFAEVLPRIKSPPSAPGPHENAIEPSDIRLIKGPSAEGRS